jgi:hypothetical protein
MLFDKPLRDHHPIVQLLLLIGLCLSSGGLFALIALKSAESVTGIAGTLVADWLQTPDPMYIPYIWWVQSLSAFGVFVLPGIIWAYYYDYDTPWQPLGLHIRQKPTIWLYVGILVIVISPLIYWIYGINQQMELPEAWSALEASMKTTEEESEKTIKLLLSATGTQAFLINILVIAILPALGEELLFRGVLQNIFRGLFNNPHIAIWLGAILFSALHMQWYGFLPRLLLGAMFGYIYFWSGSIMLSIFAHFINNGAAVAVEMWGGEGGSEAIENALLNSPWWLILVSLLAVAILLRAIHLHTQNIQTYR